MGRHGPARDFKTREKARGVARDKVSDFATGWR